MAKKKRSRQRAMAQPAQGPVELTNYGIPKQITDEMGKRALLFGGPPTLMVFLTFPVAYFLLSQGVKVSDLAVLVISIGFIPLASGCAVYGMLSTPWVAGEATNWFGWRNFRMNLDRLLAALREEGEKTRIEKQQLRGEK
jgi:hypothetical protein